MRPTFYETTLGKKLLIKTKKVNYSLTVFLYSTKSFSSTSLCFNYNHEGDNKKIVWISHWTQFPSSMRTSSPLKYFGLHSFLHLFSCLYWSRCVLCLQQSFCWWKNQCSKIQAHYFSFGGGGGESLGRIQRCLSSLVSKTSMKPVFQKKNYTCLSKMLRFQRRPTNVRPFVSDIDECVLKSHSCDGNATCLNTAGAFNCSCNHGYRGNGFSCAGKVLN